MNPHHRILITAAAILDGEGRYAAPGAVLVEGDVIQAAGTPQDVGRVDDAQTLCLPDAVVIPPLVNVHCHLDLSHIGPVPYDPDGGFVNWVKLVRQRRASTDPDIAAAVARGVQLARAGGTALIGDIAGNRSLAPLRALRDAGLGGVSYLEVFGIGARQSAAAAMLRQLATAEPPLKDGVAFGVQPHAPYSCGLEVYQTAAALNMPMATHLAETVEEIQFTRTGDGPLAAMLKQIGVWDESITVSGMHPIDHLASVLAQRPCVAAHLNYVDERHIEQLAAWPITVAYCPRASAYFRHPHSHSPSDSPDSLARQSRHCAPNLEADATGSHHRYRDMLRAGINVALGTDSLLCLETPDRISVLDDARLLYRRDGADPITLLRMATINGARALGFDPQLVTLAPGPVAGLLALPIDPHDAADPLQQIFQRDDAPRWVIGPFRAQDNWHQLPCNGNGVCTR